jgi:hypothetical protein
VHMQWLITSSTGVNPMQHTKGMQRQASSRGLLAFGNNGQIMSAKAN